MAKLVKCKRCEFQVAKAARYCVRCSVKSPGRTSSDHLINCLSAISLTVFIMLLYKVSTANQLITISDVEAAGFEKQYQRSTNVTNALDGWAGHWKSERIELYQFSDTTAVDLEFFSRQAAPGNAFGWTDACIHKNVILLSDGRIACRILKNM